MKDTQPYMSNCDSCGFFTSLECFKGIERAKGQDVWLCKVCKDSIAGGGQIRGYDQDSTYIIRHICHMTNIILEAINEIRQVEK